MYHLDNMGDGFGQLYLVAVFNIHSLYCINSHLPLIRAGFLSAYSAPGLLNNCLWHVTNEQYFRHGFVEAPIFVLTPGAYVYSLSNGFVRMMYL